MNRSAWADDSSWSTMSSWEDDSAADVSSDVSASRWSTTASLDSTETPPWAPQYIVPISTQVLLDLHQGRLPRILAPRVPPTAIDTNGWWLPIALTVGHPSPHPLLHSQLPPPITTILDPLPQPSSRSYRVKPQLRPLKLLAPALSVMWF